MGNSLTVAFLIFGNLAYTPNDYAQQFARLRRQFGIIVTTWVAFSLKLINASVSLVKAMECLGRQNGRSASLELDPIDVQWESSSTQPMDRRLFDDIVVGTSAFTRTVVQDIEQEMR